MDVKRQRTDYDILRIMLVMLVVIGHGAYYTSNTPFGGIYYDTLMLQNSVEDTWVHEITSLLTNWIYSFHMPVFVSLSGAVFTLQMKRNKYTNLHALIRDKARRLLVPLLAVWILWNIPIKYISGYYSGISLDKIILQLLFPNGVYLWYLEALFIVFVICYVLNKHITDYRMQFVWAFLFLLVGLFWEKVMGAYVLLGNPLKYVMWFLIGMRVDELRDYLSRMKIPKMFWIIGCLCLQIVVYVGALFIGRGLWLINNTVTAILMLLVLYPLTEQMSQLITRQKGKEKIAKIASYTFGIYLYSAPLNYLILYGTTNKWGIEILGNEMGALAIWCTRIVGTTLVSIIIVTIMRKIKIR